MTASIIAAALMTTLAPAMTPRVPQRTVFVGPREAAVTAETVKTACANVDSPACKAATEALAQSVAVRLGVFGRTRQDRYRGFIYAAAYLPWAEVRAAAAAALGAMGPNSSDTSILAELLNDPVSEVRYNALRALQAGYEHAGRQLAERANGEQGHLLTPDPEPSAEQAGVPLHAGARFQFFTSDVKAGRLAFATDEAMDAVVQFYAAKFGPATPLDALVEPARATTPDQAAAIAMALEAQRVYQAAIAAGKSRQEAADAMQRSFTGAAGLDVSAIRSRYNKKDQYGSPQVIVIAKNKSGRPERILVVFTDLVLKETGFVVHQSGR
jgi:hypothetical protein